MSTATDGASSSEKGKKKPTRVSKDKAPTTTKKRKNSRKKGAVGELEFAHLLTELGYPANRTQQFCGRGGDSADVKCELLQHLHFEVKRTEHLSIYKAMAQAESDAKCGRVPIVAHRSNGRRGTERPWLAILTVKDLLKLIEKAKNEEVAR